MPAEIPKIRTMDELTAYIEERLAAGGEYSADAEIARDCALAAFSLADESLGMTGFQASCSALDFLASVNGYKGPFRIVSAERSSLLWPQYPSPAEQAEESIEEWREWAAERAREHLAEYDSGAKTFVAERVLAHWRKVAEYTPKEGGPRGTQ